MLLLLLILLLLMLLILLLMMLLLLLMLMLMLMMLMLMLMLLLILMLLMMITMLAGCWWLSGVTEVRDTALEAATHRGTEGHKQETQQIQEHPPMSASY